MVGPLDKIKDRAEDLFKKEMNLWLLNLAIL